MKSNDRYKSKFFPFSAGIPWKIERGKYIVPEIDSETWHKVLDNRPIIITAFGGLLESFFSLAAAEALVSFDPGHRIFWLGHQEYSFFVRVQNLCKLSQIAFKPEILKSYPTPIFLDADGNAYLNVLNNYLERTSYWGKYPEPVNAPVLEQMFQNVMVPWRQSYIPKLRNLGIEFFDELRNTGRLRQRTKVVCIVLNASQNDVLGWNMQNLKEFTQLASHKGLKVVIFTHDVSVFYGTKILAHEYDLRKILQVIINSWMVLSSDIQWLLIALMLTDARLISKQMDGPFDLFKNAEVLGAQNDIFTDRERMSPIDAFTICEGLL
jgi:hypothetical protein